MITKNAYAKINLSLEILDKRADGYHNIRSVMQKVSLCDILEFEFNTHGRISLECDVDVCPQEDNLAYKAAVLYKEKYKNTNSCDIGVSIKIQKNIPDKAGLAGGSADCACVLDAMYEHFGGISYDDVEEIAASLGSDINFCLDRYRCALCTDRGIRLDACTAFDCDNVVICVPDTGMKTSDIYRRFDASPILYPDDPTGKIVSLLNSGKQHEIYPHIKNSFAPICEDSCADITEIKRTMLSCGALASQMSGSGSSVFGFFSDRDTAEKCRLVLTEKFKKVFVCKTVIR